MPLRLRSSARFDWLRSLSAAACVAASMVPSDGFAEPSEAAVTASARARSAPGSGPDVLGVPSILERDGRGGFVYHGSGFDAQIAPNGNVSMRDRYGRFYGLWGTFDLTAMAEAAAGNDPYLSERRAFFDATRSFREALIVRSDQGTLVRQLTAIRFDRRLTPSQRKARTFAVWDEMTEDEKGAEGRQLLEDFVRRQYVGDEQISQAELTTFNARRQSRQSFDPYQAKTPH